MSAGCDAASDVRSAKGRAFAERKPTHACRTLPVSRAYKLNGDLVLYAS